MSGAAAVRSLRPLSAVVVPEWLAEIVRPRRAPVPCLVVVGLAGFEPATSATQNCYERPARVLALY